MKPLVRRVKNLLSIATLSGLGCLTGSAAEASRAAAKTLVYFGTYTGAKSRGIYVSRLNAATGQLTGPELAAETISPSFLAIHPNHRFVYAVNEVGEFNGKPGGAVSAFSLDAATGRLTLLNQQASGGGGPCHIVVDRTGKHALVANYGGGSVTVLPVKEDGRLGEATSFIQHTGSSMNPNRQKEPHAHSINLDIANRFAFAADLGLDKVVMYRFDAAKGTLTPNDPPFAKLAPGAGPRHFALHPKGGFAYVINELHCTVTAFSYDPQRGELKELQTVSTLPQGQSVQPSFSTAEVQVHPSGKFLYGSNRGHDSVAVFTIDEQTGRLTHVENQSTRGKTPRNFGIDPTGKYLLAANQSSDSVAVFRIDDKSGRLTPDGGVVDVGTPVCVKFVVLP